mgnify:CR=1 FL=1
MIGFNNESIILNMGSTPPLPTAGNSVTIYAQTRNDMCTRQTHARLRSCEFRLDQLTIFCATCTASSRFSKSLSKIADRWAGGKMISVLEGGYNPKGLASAAVAHFRAMAE